MLAFKYFQEINGQISKTALLTLIARPSRSRPPLYLPNWLGRHFEL